MRRGDRGRQLRRLKLDAGRDRIEAAVDRIPVGFIRVVILGFVNVDGEHHPLAGVEVFEVDDQIGRAVEHRERDRADVIRKIGAEQRGLALQHETGDVGDRVEEHVVFVETVAVLVAADDEPLELRTGRAADEADLESIRGEVATGIIFGIHDTDVSRRGGEHLPLFDRFEPALTRRFCRRSLAAAQAATPKEKLPHTHDAPPCSSSGRYRSVRSVVGCVSAGCLP